MRTAAAPFRSMNRTSTGGSSTQFTPQQHGRSPSQSAGAVQRGQPQPVQQAVQPQFRSSLSNSGRSFPTVQSSAPRQVFGSLAQGGSSGSGLAQSFSQDVTTPHAIKIQTPVTHVRTFTPPRREVVQISNADSVWSFQATETRPIGELTAVEQATAAAIGAAVTRGFDTSPPAQSATLEKASENDRATGISGPSSEFVKLVKSLEERVELMAQMQRARAQLKDRMESIEFGGSEPSTLKRQENVAAPRFPKGAAAGTGRPADEVLVQPSRDTESLQFGMEEISRARQDRQQLHDDRDALLAEREKREKITSQLTQENGELFVQLRTQGQQISELRSSLQELQQALQNCHGSTAERDLRLQEARTVTQRGAQECQQLRQQLVNERSHFEESQKTWQADRLRLERQLQLAAREGPGSLGLHLKSEADVTSLPSRSSASASDTGLGVLHEQMAQQTQRLGELERSLNAKLVSGIQSPYNVQEDVVSTLPGTVQRSLVATTPASPAPMPTRLLDVEGPPTALMQELLPWSRKKLGLNIALSEDGYTATRTKGCRQSVVLGQGPLEKGPFGWYFEVEVRETVLGWVGGLGIGVTLTDENLLRRVPDKAWRLPRTYIMGYWGRVFCDGREYRAPWHTDEIAEGSVVGLLVTEGGELLVFVDGQQKVRIDARVPVGSESLYPVVDVFAATQSVVLRKRAEPPSPPWNAAQATLSPPDSPTSSMQSGNLSSISVSPSSPEKLVL